MTIKKQNRIIFIGGTPFSGSTLLDLMISNAKDAFSCGEVYALFRPFKEHHFDPECGCLDPKCNLWSEIVLKGEHALYKTIFNYFPNVDLIVDSSKRISWINAQNRYIQKNDYKIYNVLIYKKFDEFYYSCFKRNKQEFAQDIYFDYHIRYIRNINNWRSINYSILAKNPNDELRSICKHLEIKYFPGKELYWNKTHHTLFGSNTALINLYAKNSYEYFQVLNRNNSESWNKTNLKRNEQSYRKIYYRKTKKRSNLYPPIKKNLAIQKLENILKRNVITINNYNKKTKISKKEVFELMIINYFYKINRRIKKLNAKIRKVKHF